MFICLFYPCTTFFTSISPVKEKVPYFPTVSICVMFKFSVILDYVYKLIKLSLFVCLLFLTHSHPNHLAVPLTESQSTALAVFSDPLFPPLLHFTSFRSDSSASPILFCPLGECTSPLRPHCCLFFQAPPRSCNHLFFCQTRCFHFIPAIMCFNPLKLSLFFSFPSLRQY